MQNSTQKSGLRQGMPRCVSLARRRAGNLCGAGVPQALYDRHNEHGSGKAKVASLVLRDLASAGATGHTLQRKVIEQPLPLKGH
jgi:hypothetical protein